MSERKRTTVEERKAFCQQHGHSWIVVEYSSYRRCSWCGEYEPLPQVVECFIYPRLLLNALVGYDFGFFVQNRYIIIGNSKAREDAERLLHEWANEHQREITIIHEQEPSKSKNLQERLWKR